MHTYAAAGQDSVKVALADGAPGAASATAISTATVTQPLSGQVVLKSIAEGVATAGTVATFTDTNLADTASAFTAAIHWGDGTTTTGAVTGGNGSFTVAGGHAYGDEGSFQATTTLIRTSDHVQAVPTGTVTVTEGDVLTPQGTTISANAGTSFDGVVGTFTDTNIANAAGDFTATIDWGDGMTTSGIVSDVNGAIAVAGTHTYAAAGQDSVKVTLSDDAPGTATATAQNTADVVQDFSGQVTLTSAKERVAIAGGSTIATFTDTNTSDAASKFTASIDWGDGTTTAAVVSGSNGSFTVSAPASGHVYTGDEGNVTLTTVVTAAGDPTLRLSGPVAITENDALTPQGVTIAATAGTSFNAVVANFTDTDTGNTASDFSASIAWGDGSTTTGIVTDINGAIAVSGTHTYASAGQDAVTVTLMDDAPGTSSATAQGTATVGPQPSGNRLVLSSAAEGVPVFGTIAAFTDLGELIPPGANNFTATIFWGDGTQTFGSITGDNGQFFVSPFLSHTYADEGRFALSISIAKDGQFFKVLAGGVQVGEVDVLAAQPTTIAAAASTPFNGVVASFSDTNPNNVASDFTATIDWGDGTTTAGVVSNQGRTTFQVSGTHTYATGGHDVVKVTLTDDAPGAASVTASSAADIAGSTLVATGASLTAIEGNQATATVATFTDADPNATAGDFTATINWGDGTSSSGTVAGNGVGGFSVSGAHAYAEEGHDPISVSITDVGGSTASATGTATVADAALTAAGVSVTATEGASTTATVATFTDANPNATASEFTATINWGDGTSSTGTVAADGVGGFSVTGTHTYAEDGSNPVIVTINDAGGQSASTTGTATVADAALVAAPATVSFTEFANPVPAVVATFTDANPNATASDFTATVDWGDGTSSDAAVAANGAGGFNVVGQNQYTEEGQYTVGVTITDADGSTAHVSSTATVADAALAAAPVSLSATEGAAINATVATFTEVVPFQLPTTVHKVAPPTVYTATIDWGDGTTATAGTVTPNRNGVFHVNGAHVYADEGSHNVSVTIADDGGSMASATSTATVADAPLVAAGVNVNATEGASATATVATFTDANPNAPASDFTATINWGDGTSSTGTVAGNGVGGFSVGGAHT
jgi:hypothetical protein